MRRFKLSIFFTAACILIEQLTASLKNIDNLNLRIGIHQGDIIQEDRDVFGDDVNIASRIEPFATPGGIAVSQKIQQTRSKVLLSENMPTP
jgi:class 3 adenylate cyclase